MTLSDSDIAYLTASYKRLQKNLDSKKFEGSFRWVARQEAILMLLNLAGWAFDYERQLPYKRTQKEKREYFDADSTN